MDKVFSLALPRLPILERIVECKEIWDAKGKFLLERGQAQKYVSTHPYISFAP
jgi:hypothetical protein